MSVRVNALDEKEKPKTSDFRLVSPSLGGHLPPAVFGAPDGSPRWTPLMDREGTIEKEGRTYELVYIIGPGTKEAALHYKDKEIGKFAVPW